MQRASARGSPYFQGRRIGGSLVLYEPDAIVVPTLSDTIRDCEDERRRYFERFLADGIRRCTINHENLGISRTLSTVVVGGLHTFGFPLDGSSECVPARRLFTDEQVDDRWLVSRHHSSRLTQAD